jgi:hypothetical protein
MLVKHISEHIYLETKQAAMKMLAKNFATTVLPLQKNEGHPLSEHPS